MTPHRVGAALAALLLAAPPLAGVAGAQGTARSLDIDTSIRAAGMGGAGVAVGWGEPSVWGNPAAIGLVSGVRWEYGRTQLVPGLATDVFLRSTRTLVGGAGLGLALSGDPLGGIKLDYGPSLGTDPFGNPTGTYDSFERTDAWGGGVSLATLADGVNALRGRPSTLARLADVAVGFQRKHVQVALDPSNTASADQVDWGVLARVSPLSLLPGADSPLRPRLDLSGGVSVLNASDAMFTFAPFPAVPPSRIRRVGFAAHSALPGPWTRPQARSLAGLLRSGFAPLAEAGLAFDAEHVTAGGGPPNYDVTRMGMEVSLLGVATVRTGHVTDRTGDIDGTTFGWALAAPLGPFAGVRYDHASIPQARDSGLPDVQRHGWTAWVNPIEVWRWLTP